MPMPKQNACAAFVLALHVAHNLVFVGRANGRLAVGEEYDYERTLLFARPQRQRLAQRIVDRGAAHRLEILDEIFGAGAIRLRRVHQLVEQRLHFCREADDFQAVAVVQVFDENWSAFFACSSFLPAIEPEVSSTNATSLETTCFSFTSRPGDASSRK